MKCEKKNDSKIPLIKFLSYLNQDFLNKKNYQISFLAEDFPIWEIFFSLDTWLFKQHWNNSFHNFLDHSVNTSLLVLLSFGVYFDAGKLQITQFLRSFFLFYFHVFKTPDISPFVLSFSSQVSLLLRLLTWQLVYFILFSLSI